MNSFITEKFGLYVHIPYCLQICTYCDFVKFESRDLPPTDEYISLLQRELKTRSHTFGNRELSSVYFGGGTPSLFAPAQILTILQSIANEGFTLAKSAEITLEINPGTITEASLEEFQRIGVTRFSVGAQTFDEDLLKVTGRKHSVSDTIATLEMLAARNVNYSFDLLFGLPGQRLNGVGSDLERALAFRPSHLSAYNLTVPAKHGLNIGRASDDEQAEMFELIETKLAANGIFRYEVSNFSRPGFESQHNVLYWSDAPYWGIGIGSHSYIPRGDRSIRQLPTVPWGVRFWNPPTIAAYRKELDRAELLTATSHDEPEPFWSSFAGDRVERLAMHEALTDFSHTALRSQLGLNLASVKAKFGSRAHALARERLADSRLVNFVSVTDETWRLTRKGQAMADRVFESLTFLKDDRVEV